MAGCAPEVDNLWEPLPLPRPGSGESLRIVQVETNCFSSKQDEFNLVDSDPPRMSRVLRSCQGLECNFPHQDLILPPRDLARLQEFLEALPNAPSCTHGTGSCEWTLELREGGKVLRQRSYRFNTCAYGHLPALGFMNQLSKRFVLINPSKGSSIGGPPGR